MSAWATLGIERTGDVAAIRRAYARKLKAMDVDADPEGFIALRQALNGALWDATVPPEPGELPGEAELPTDETNAIAESGLGPSDESGLDWPDLPPDRPDSSDPEDQGTRFVELERMLFPGEDGPAPDEAELIAAVRSILHHPRMAHIDHSSAVEHWLADILHHSALSDPVTPLVVEHFGWDRHAGQWDQPWQFDELVKRRDGLRMIERVSRPGDPFHKAWLDLTSDSPRLGFKTMSRASEVGSLLTAIRENCPTAEARLDPHRVALWEARLNRSIKRGLSWAVFVFWGLFILSRFVISINAPPPASVSPSAPPIMVYTNPEFDLEPYIREASQGQLDLSKIAERNPPLHDRLIERWQRAREAGGQDFLFAGDIRGLLRHAARDGLRGGGYAVQAAYWRVELEELRWRRSVDVDDCHRLISGGTVSARPLDLAQRREAVLAQALAAAPSDPPPPLGLRATHRFRIPGPVVEKISERTGLTGEALAAALLDGGTPAQRCDVNIALIEAALSLPEARGAPLLRDMSAGL